MNCWSFWPQSAVYLSNAKKFKSYHLISDFLKICCFIKYLFSIKTSFFQNWSDDLMFLAIKILDVFVTCSEKYLNFNNYILSKDKFR